MAAAASADRSLDLPPPFVAVPLRERGDALAHARAIAPEAEPGTLVVVGRFDVAECAVVLTPEEPLATARRAIYAGLQALADTLAAEAPPERPITIDWPDALRFDGALVGGVALAEPAGAAEDVVPPWLVLGAQIRVSAAGGREPGERPGYAALDELGFDDPDPRRLVEGFARHLLVAFDGWQADGFEPLARELLARLPREAGVRRGIAPNGDLLLQRAGAAGPPERFPLVPRLAAPSWRDPRTGLPWL